MFKVLTFGGIYKNQELVWRTSGKMPLTASAPNWNDWFHGYYLRVTKYPYNNFQIMRIDEGLDLYVYQDRREKKMVYMFVQNSTLSPRTHRKLLF